MNLLKTVFWSLEKIFIEVFKLQMLYMALIFSLSTYSVKILRSFVAVPSPTHPTKRVSERKEKKKKMLMVFYIFCKSMQHACFVFIKVCLEIIFIGTTRVELLHGKYCVSTYILAW
ncbi:hypothetical protein Droror1_Dr00025936 [Drosera rotundifolia]